MREDFDHQCRIFTDKLRDAVEWKDVFMGAAYSTRLTSAIAFVREACDRMEKVIAEDIMP